MISLENKNEPLISPTAFAWRMAASVAAAIGIIGISLAGGMIGYHAFESLPWIDAFVNAAMILSGMGPVAEMQTWWGKLFAGCYALYSGMVVIVVMGLVLGPPLHRLMHRFHVDDDDAKQD